MTKKTYYAFFICALLASQAVKAQEILKKDTLVAANTNYDKAGAVKRFLLGDHYRSEWATPVNLRILDLDSAGGGLTPLKLGGGHQTKSLRLQGKDGKEYVLRSVNKDPSKVMPAEFTGTFAADVVQDQISSSNPYAPLAVAALADAAGIFHTTPEIVYVPASARLGEFVNDFGSTMCLFEERPTGNEEGNPAFGFSKNIVNSQKLFEKLMTNSDHHVDERSFLKARLFDMWIGDWDRHEDQWVWAVFKEGDQTIYKPIPRDRDQAFAKLDGVIPQMATKPWAIRNTQHFDDKIKDLNGLNMSASFLDHNFTRSLSLQDWVAIAKELQQNLTNEKIEAAFKNMPRNTYDISGQDIIAKLKNRRIDLVKYATDYYKFLAEEVSIVATQANELFEINRLNDDSTIVKLYKLDQHEQPHGIVYQRVFLRAETEEIRLYGMGGNDKFHVTGEVHKGILIRVIGGSGMDSVLDESIVKNGVNRTRLYDNSAVTVDENGELKKYISEDTLKNNFNRSSFKYDWFSPKLSLGYNADDGIYLGGGLIFKKQQFGKAPYGYMQSFWGNYAASTGAYNFWYEGIFKEAVGKWDVMLNAKINAPNYVLNYYGSGNETVKYEAAKDYYRVRANQLIVSPSLFRQLSKKQTVSIGLDFESVKIERSANRFVTSSGSKLDSTIFDRNYFGGANLTYQFNTTDDPLYPREGIRVNAAAEFTQDLKDGKSNFGKLSSDVSLFASHGALTAAIRVGAATNIGDDYTFYQANTLGGSANLRGFSRTRFTGKTSFYQNAELRYKFMHMNGYLLRGNWGVLAFFDNGRVWVPEETSNTWHYGYGGGIWFLPYNKIAFTATYGVSKEDKLVNIKAGFFF